MALTSSQLEAIETADRSVAVIAGAGSGKTSVLIEHVRHLITSANVPIYKIAAFTFTEKAAGEIKERLLTDSVIRPEEEALTHTGTVHSFCNRLIRRFAPRLNLDPNFTIAGDTQTAIECDEIIRNHLLDRLNHEDPFTAKMTDRFGFERLAGIFKKLLSLPLVLQKTYPSLPAPSDEALLLEQAKGLFEKWQGQKRAARRLDFNDLEFLAVKLLAQFPDIQKRVQMQYSHILVDEFQDTNPIQGELIGLLYNPSLNSVFIVGDPKQSIYRFRRADVSVFRRMIKKIREDGGKIVQLAETFRLPPAVCEALNRIFAPLFGKEGSNTFFKPMESKKTDQSGRFVTVTVPGEKMKIDQLREWEAKWIAETLAQMNLSPEECQETALLFRTSRPMGIYRHELIKAGIPCRVTATDPLLSTPVIRDLTHLLAYLAGDRSLLVQTGILRSPFFGFSESFIEKYIRCRPAHFLDSLTHDLFSAREDQSKWMTLVRLFGRWERFAKTVPPSSLFALIVDDLMQDGEKGDGIRSSWMDEEGRLNLEQWLKLVDDLEEESPLDLAVLHRMMKQAKESGKALKTLDIKTAAGAVHLMTIHAAKGLEFKRVFLPQIYAREQVDTADCLIDADYGLALKTEASERTGGLKRELTESPLMSQLKLKEALEEREEAKRLLYVALTRTKEELYLFLKEPGKKNNETKESRSWNEWLWPFIPPNQPTPSRSSKPF